MVGSNEGIEGRYNLSGWVVFASLDEMFREGWSEEWTFVLRAGITTFLMEEAVIQAQREGDSQWNWEVASPGHNLHSVYVLNAVHIVGHWRLERKVGVAELNEEVGVWINLRSKRGLRVRPLRSCESLERAGVLIYQLWHLIECVQQRDHEIWLNYIISNIRNSFSLMFDNSYLGTAPEASYHQPSSWDNRWEERGKGYSGNSWSWNYTIHYCMEIHRWKKLGGVNQYWNWQRSVSCQYGRASWNVNPPVVISF